MTAARVYLVTGASGVVGGALVPELLQEPAARVCVLLRAADRSALQARLDSLLEYWSGAASAADLSGRVVAVAGDVTRPRLGLGDAEHAELSATVTNIVHAAGDVNLARPLEAARQSAVHAAQEVIAYARASRRGEALPKIEYLSTVGVAGRRQGIVPEQPLPDTAAFHNTYEQAKAEAEALMLREIATGLPVTIHRPSMVVGDARTGRINHFQVFYYLAPFLAGSRTRGVLPRFGDVRLDLVPADYVARAIAASARRPDAIGRILHLCAGPDAAAPLGALAQDIRCFLAARGETVHEPHYVPRGWLRAGLRIVRPLMPRDARRALQTLPFFLDYLDEAQVFANAQTRRYLDADIGPPPRPLDFLPAILEYWYPRRRKR